MAVDVDDDVTGGTGAGRYRYRAMPVTMAAQARAIGTTTYAMRAGQRHQHLGEPERRGVDRFDDVGGVLDRLDDDDNPEGNVSGQFDDGDDGDGFGVHDGSGQLDDCDDGDGFDVHNGSGQLDDGDDGDGFDVHNGSGQLDDGDDGDGFGCNVHDVSDRLDDDVADGNQYEAGSNRDVVGVVVVLLRCRHGHQRDRARRAADARLAARCRTVSAAAPPATATTAAAANT